MDADGLVFQHQVTSNHSAECMPICFQLFVGYSGYIYIHFASFLRIKLIEAKLCIYASVN